MNDHDNHDSAPPPPPNGNLPPLTPAKIEQLMDRMLATPEFQELALADDLGPLCMAVKQATEARGADMDGRMQAWAVTMMVASWGIAAYARKQGAATTEETQ